MNQEQRAASNEKCDPASTKAQQVTNNSSWTIEDSKQLYGVEGWGEPYFSVNEAGNITVSPQYPSSEVTIDLYELVQSLQKRNIGLPLLIRFSEILSDRIARLVACMQTAIAKYNYSGIYQGVFPVKCNQNRHLVEDLVRYGKPYNFGLEVGSKPELMIALAALETEPDGDYQPLLICNGYKDREYIETALLATKLGQKIIIVIEQPQELDLAWEISQKLAIKPILGVRAKLNTQGSGRWGTSTGDRAKFGLTIPQIVDVVNKLKTTGMRDCLQLLHFHIGSQISSIAVIKNAIREASQIYVQLAKTTGNMQYIDVGGGLAVDYDGSKSNFPASKNYNMQNYANDIVAQLKDACDMGQVSHPIIISESGRAIASHQSVLVFDILSANQVSVTTPQPLQESEHLIIRNLWEAYNSIDLNNYQETYNDAIQFREEAFNLFNLGYFSLTERARAEKLYWACCCKIAQIIHNINQSHPEQRNYIPDELKDLEQIMASIYYANLSIFQSIPDSWAINQLFPLMPIHRLQEKPIARGIIADLTCDSDGKLDTFINLRDTKPVLELHPLNQQPYYLGMFLVGAYQETMGNLHNLFGDTNLVHIQATTKGYRIKYVVKGDTVREVLNHVQYNSEDLRETMRCRTEIALQNNRLSLEEAQKLLQNYESSLSSYTYLKNS
ncbi:Biosynthetic arginine decarboxylase [Hyella patelloides LEGE 07179]|uniref:Biosynthetic arginine decarboxylase n=1 Tax=Hyella patelloides LEGE 07179 TaxID=945734 RepID=A0A563W4D1_9CYAN|nr:biosynthetic arginine decarboxylase [Hyella patelloides]VEP18525.1 Biosynthetic arginine decarboxylase [Hyella patelloides LEGE 07179]